MLEWKRVQLMITNYAVMDEEFISKKRRMFVLENRSLPGAPCALVSP